MDKMRKDFETYLGYPYGLGKVPSGDYADMLVQYMWAGWKMAHNKYSQDSQKYIDLLRDLYYTHGYELPAGSFQKIKKLLGDLL